MESRSPDGTDGGLPRLGRSDVILRRYPVEEERDATTLSQHPDGSDDSVDVRLPRRSLPESADRRSIVHHDDEAMMLKVMAPTVKS